MPFILPDYFNCSLYNRPDIKWLNFSAQVAKINARRTRARVDILSRPSAERVKGDATCVNI